MLSFPSLRRPLAGWLLFFFAALARAALADSPVWSAGVPDGSLDARLDYGTFRGAYSSAYNITYWKTLPYAAPPVGQNRFRAPQPPEPIDDTLEDHYDCDRPFPMCPQRETNGTEDCLYLGLYGRPWQSGQPLRPVVVVFYGGGFIRGSAALGLPPAAYPVLNVSSSAENDLLFVYPNYRTNVFGFLPGRQVGQDPRSDTNAGLLDQQAALRWVQRYARVFGGDSRNVSIWGQSAGGGSVVAQVVAQGAAKAPQTPLFHRALASSPYWPKTHRYDAPASQQIYDDLVQRVGCNMNSSTAQDGTLACLKAADVQTLRAASLAMTADRDATATSSYVWAPVLDDAFIRQPLSTIVAAAKERRGGADAAGLTAAFSTYNTHEGENFIPSWLFPKASSSSNASALFHTWLMRYLPDLTADDVAQVGQLYPEAGDVEDEEDGKRSNNSSSNNTSPYSAYSAGNALGRAGLVYRDITLACPAYWMTGLAGEGNGTTGWLAEYSIAPAKHASDTYWWNTVNQAQTADPLHYQGYAGAIASFLAAGDPNARKLTGAAVPGAPAMASGRAWTITSGGFATRSLARLRQRCDFWLSAAPRASV